MEQMVLACFHVTLAIARIVILVTTYAQLALLDIIGMAPLVIIVVHLALLA